MTGPATMLHYERLEDMAGALLQDDVRPFIRVRFLEFERDLKLEYLTIPEAKQLRDLLGTLLDEDGVR